MTSPTSWFLDSDLETWLDFKELVVEAIENGLTGAELGNVWFRGQGDAEWPLVASFDRIFGTLPSAARSNVYDHMVERFRERSSLVEGLSGLQDEALICIMQHYGAPTRVLDWTTSPYVAAYFAFASASSIALDPDSADACAIWMLHARADIFAGLRTLKLIHIAPSLNPRAWSQHGRFTLNLSNERDLLEELRRIHADPIEKPPSWIVHKISIPRSEAAVAMRDLELMGLTSETLFPGLEGTAKYSFFQALDEAGLLG